MTGLDEISGFEGADFGAEEIGMGISLSGGVALECWDIEGDCAIELDCMEIGCGLITERDDVDDDDDGDGDDDDWESLFVLIMECEIRFLLDRGVNSSVDEIEEEPIGFLNRDNKLDDTRGIRGSRGCEVW